MSGQCNCCGGRGSVLDILGEPRPCSRCRVDDFHRWYEARAQAEQARLEAVRIEQNRAFFRANIVEEEHGV